MKNLKYFLIINFLIFSISLQATPPNWSVNQASYSYNMTITGVVNINFEEITTSNNIIGAFVGEECRGVATTFYQSTVDRYVYYLMIYGNTSNEELTFKFYDATSDLIIDLLSTINFQVNGIVGNAETPFVFANQILSNEAEILTFSINGQLENSISENEVEILMPYGTDLSNLIPTFTLSENADAFIGLIEQESGTSVNDFSEPIIYKIVAQNGNFQNWTVNVSIVSEVNEIEVNNLIVFPNPTTDYINIRINAGEVFAKAVIYNSNGQIVLTENISSNNSQISLSDLSSGNYVIIIDDGAIRYRKEFVKF